MLALIGVLAAIACLALGTVLIAPRGAAILVATSAVILIVASAVIYGSGAYGCAVCSNAEELLFAIQAGAAVALALSTLVGLVLGARARIKRVSRQR